MSSICTSPGRLAAIAVTGLIGLATLFVWDPATTRVFPPCPFRAVTGCYCPGCGTLRGLHQLLHGNMAGALRMNPLMVLSLPLVMYLSIADFAWGQRRPMGLPAWAIWMLLAVVISYWAMRNIPTYPFTLLAPH